MSNSIKAKIKCGICRDPQAAQCYSSMRTQAAGELRKGGHARPYGPGHEEAPSALTVPSCMFPPALPGQTQVSNTLGRKVSP